jgi:hypothetical protein
MNPKKVDNFIYTASHIILSTDILEFKMYKGVL